MHSCMYVGRVRHRRRADIEHQFCYRLWWSYLDLDEIPELVGQGLLSRSRWGKAHFCAQRHQRDRLLVDRPGCQAPHARQSSAAQITAFNPQALREAICDAVQKQVGWRPNGPIRMLAQLTHFGIYFSPLTIYYVFDQQERLIASVAEVNNTPWGEQHSYILTGSNDDACESTLQAESWSGSDSSVVAVARPPRLPELRQCSHAKVFHVSPFMEMEKTYAWRISPPSERLTVHIDCESPNGAVDFDATMVLKKRKLTRGNLLRCVCARPLTPLWILGGIYFEALRLWLKGARFVPHPNKNKIIER